MGDRTELLNVPDGLVPEARTLAMEMGIRADFTPAHLLSALLMRRNDLLLLLLDDARVDPGRLRLELEERIAEGRIETGEQALTSLRFLLNQGVLIAQRYGQKRVTGDHMTGAIVEHHPNGASRLLMERGVSMDVAKRWIKSELSSESEKERPEMLMKRVARRLEGRCRVRFPSTLINRLLVLAEEYFSAQKGTSRAEQLKMLVQTLAAEAMERQMPEALRKLHREFSDARRRADEAVRTGKTTVRRRSIMEELRLRENYLRSLADWLEKQPYMDIDDEAVRRAIASVGNIPIGKVVV